MNFSKCQLLINPKKEKEKNPMVSEKGREQKAEGQH
ncbi:hypothetical protein LCGC14_0160790 [marine sediment metagenome]|uniref:Uncharacterized protein n=1 Tax=marine sediment metagenome TaxID=412755 RepID=A0A0F9XDK9_9ZZZZ